MKKLSWLLLLFLSYISAFNQIPKEIFEFEFEGIKMHGVLNVPENQAPKGIVLIVHGSGQTNAVAQNWYNKVRAKINESGYATYMWDKKGCGKSEGTFDYNQPVQNSAEEVIAAIEALQADKIPGSETIGLWGISRAGWINPLVINQYEGIRFWISVSGVDDKENFGYLLSQNLRINGHPKEHIELLLEEWTRGNEIAFHGGSYESYLEATVNLRKNPFIIRFNNGGGNEAGYYEWQKQFMTQGWDSVTRLPMYIEDFEKALLGVDCPVLALFGEKDMNVDWRKTKALYERTLGSSTDLSIQSFPNTNHNLFLCKTGGFYEIQDDKLGWNRSQPFLDAMGEWLHKLD
ncbi:MAG: alpha/beta hydrolase [Bacteroidota bacterium]